MTKLDELKANKLLPKRLNKNELTSRNKIFTKCDVVCALKNEEHIHIFIPRRAKTILETFDKKSQDQDIFYPMTKEELDIFIKENPIVFLEAFKLGQDDMASNIFLKSNIKLNESGKLAEARIKARSQTIADIMKVIKEIYGEHMTSMDREPAKVNTMRKFYKKLKSSLKKLEATTK